jgi:serine/threonine protein kinase
VKLLPSERAGEDAIQRFEREVRLTSTLTHPNTIAIYDYGRSADGIFYYAMEHLEGVDLQALVERDGPQSPGLVAHVLSQVCDALSEAHEVGLIHRDVKPANVFLCERGRVPFVAKVLDFGLVKSLVAAPAPSGLSTTDAIRGTPLYMAPEAMRSPETVDHRIDLYAVGAVGYFLLTGRPVFEGASFVEVMAQHLQSAPVTPSERLGKPVPAVLEDVILECLAKDPDQRPSTASELSLRFAEARRSLGFALDAARAAWPRYLEMSAWNGVAPSERHVALTVRIPSGHPDRGSGDSSETRLG